MLRAIAHSRLAAFAAIGGLLFAVAPRPASTRDVEIDRASMRSLEAAEARRLGAARLSPEEASQVDARAIEDEILYREALRRGLDRDDRVVRQRLVQKMLFLAEELDGAATEPTPDELRTFFAATAARWTAPARVHFVHVYGGREHPERLRALRARAIDFDRTSSGTPPLGTAFALDRDVELTVDQVSAQYGAAFATAVVALEPLRWSDPVESRYGWHIVKVLARTAARPATFAEVEEEVRAAYAVAARGRAVDAFLSEAFERYRVTVDGQRVAKLEPLRRAGVTAIDMEGAQASALEVDAARLASADSRTTPSGASAGDTRAHLRRARTD